MDDEMEFLNTCPHCGELYNGYECEVCGYADLLECNEYETPEGNIARCSEQQALERGYIFTCPVCQVHTITWWEMEDHGMCIECWHRQIVDNRGLTLE